MPRHPKQAQYERTARQRQLLSMSALKDGWTKLSVLDAYLTGDGEIVVIDKELNRYTTAEDTRTSLVLDVAEPAAEVPVTHIGTLPEGINPDTIPDKDSASWLLGQLGDRRNGFTLSNKRKLIAKQTSILLAALSLLDRVAGPDERDQLEELAS